jgi:Uma2 family endonuclease
LDDNPSTTPCSLITPRNGGQARIREGDYIEGGPELVAEVASSSASFDAHTKLHAYRRNGVREYLLWRILDKEFDWFTLHEGNIGASHQATTAS